jgi:chemosensory pili system protein ChpC
MNAVVESVRSLWVPLDGMNLLVPNVAIAEVINYQPLDLIQDGPEWLLGSLRWRDQQLPVVSLESLFGFDLPQSERGTRISVVNSVKAGSPLSFYAMVTAGIPRLISADADALGDSLLASRNLPDTVADVVQIGNEEALIPNLETIEQSIGSVWAEFSR